MTADATAAPATQAETATKPGTPTRGHLHEVDIVRLLTFVGVVGVHAMSASMDPSDAITGGFVSLLHFTRGTFFILSAFVLTYVYGSAPVKLRRFAPRRLWLVGVPYVVWSVVYWWVALAAVPRTSNLGQLAHELFTGTANYHLYFLLVSMQLYLLFPALMWLVRRTRGHHQALFVVSAVLEIVLLTLEHYTTWPGTFAAWQVNDLALAPTYQLYFVTGALAAVHRDRLRAWVVTHSAAVVGILFAAAVVHDGVYAIGVKTTGLIGQSYDALQPSVVPWTLAVTLALYALGCQFAERRREGSRFAVFVTGASLASFGVFLVHPLFLNTLLGRWLAWSWSSLNPVLSGVLAWSGTLVLAYAFAVVVVRTPLALPLAGRRRVRTRRRTRHV